MSIFTELNTSVNKSYSGKIERFKVILFSQPLGLVEDVFNSAEWFCYKPACFDRVICLTDSKAHSLDRVS